MGPGAAAPPAAAGPLLRPAPRRSAVRELLVPNGRRRPKAAFCRSCLRLPLADRQAALRAPPNTLSAPGRRGGRRGTSGGGAALRGSGAGSSRRRRRGARRGPSTPEKADALCERDFAARPEPAAAARAAQEEAHACARADPAGARRTLGFGDSDEEVDPGRRECAYPHIAGGGDGRVRRCGERRPSRARSGAGVARGRADAGVGARQGRRAGSLVAAPRTPALASPAPPRRRRDLRLGRPAGGDARRGAADARRAAASGVARDEEASECYPVLTLVCC